MHSYFHGDNYCRTLHELYNNYSNSITSNVLYNSVCMSVTCRIAGIAANERVENSKLSLDKN